MGCKLGLLCLLIWPSVAATKTPFYRPKDHAEVKPRAGALAVVVNAASYESGVSPGSLATIFGQNLSDVSDVVVAGVNPLPTRLAGVEIDVNGIPAPIFSVAYAGGQDQISFQVPFETITGPGAAEIEVFLRGFQVADVITDSFTEDPGVFTYQGNNAIAALASNFSLLGPTNPAFPGDIIILYATGLGPVSVNVPDGYGAPSQPLAETLDPSFVFIDGEQCTTFFSGLAPGFVGLYQINLRVPRDARHGNLDLQIQTPFASSAIAKLAVQ